MNTIDAAAYLGAWPFRPLEGTPAGLSRIMRVHGIARAIVSPLDGLFHQDPEAANQRFLRQLRRLPTCCAAPIISLRIADWARRIEAYAENPQVRAVRLAPTFHGYPLAEARDLAVLAADRGLAVAVQLRMLDERFHPPFLDLPPTPLADVVALAAETPQVRWIASAARLGEVTQLGDQIRPLVNLWLDTSHVDGLDCMHRACDAVGPDHLLFSTCWPFFYAPSAFLKMQESALPADHASAILTDNAARAFSLA